jgi:hypothetical protein
LSNLARAQLRTNGLTQLTVLLGLTKWLGKRNKMLEKDFQQSVVDLAKWNGWRAHATRTVQVKSGHWLSPGIDAGFPDLILARKGELLFVECKMEKTKTRANQDLWLELLESVCRIGQVECYVWRPADWEKIVKRLTSQSKRKV